MRGNTIMRSYRVIAQSSASRMCIRSSFSGPDAAWNLLHGARVAWYITLSANALLIIALLCRRLPVWGAVSAWWILVPVLVGILGWLSAIIVLLKFARDLESTRFRMCLKCAYYLKGISDNSYCPECGSQFQIEETERIWLKWLESFGR